MDIYVPDVQMVQYLLDMPISSGFLQQSFSMQGKTCNTAEHGPGLANTC